MVCLHLLGGASIRTDAGLLTGRPAQRHRIALLAILAAAPSRSVSRDKLIGRLWPEHDTDRARHLLNVCVHILRGALGNGLLVSSGDDLRLDADLLFCDVIEFDRLVAGGEFERAVALYTGPFLDGFFLKTAPEFEQWVGAERERLARQHHRALEELAGRAEAKGDLIRAVAWWRTLAASEPYNARVARRLVQALHAAGDREGAFAFAQAHSERVASDLDTPADPTVLELAAHLRSTASSTPQLPGSRAPIEAARMPGAEPLLPVSTRTASRPWLRYAAVSLLVCLGAGTWLILRPPAEPLRTNGERVLIVPFAYRGTDEFRYLGESLVELLAAQLGADDIHPVDPAAVFKALRQAESPVPTAAQTRSLADRFGARHYITGSVIELGADRLQLQANLYDFERPGDPIARAAARGKSSELTQLVDQLGRQLLLEQRGLPRSELARLATRTTTSGPALNAYLRGEGLIRHAQLGPALSAFQSAVDADSTFALAHYRLARLYPGVVGDAGRAQAELAAALRHRAQLSPHARRLLEAYAAYLKGRAAEADRLYGELARDYPHDSEAAYLHALTALRYGPLLGYTLAEARLRFQRVRTQDPEHTVALTHIMMLAMRAHDRAVVDSLWPRVYPRGSTLMVRTLRAYAFEHSSQQRVALEGIARLRGDLMASWRLAVDLRDWEAAERVARMLLRADNAPARHAEGRVTLAYLSAIRGQFRNAHAELSRMPTGYRALTLEHRAFLAALPFAPLQRAQLDSLRVSLASLNALDGPEANSGPVGFGLADTDSMRPALQPFLRGLLSARLGQLNPARDYNAALKATVVRADTSFNRALSAALSAEIAWRDHDLNGALRHVAAAAPTIPPLLIPRSPFFAGVRERYLRGEILDALQRSDEALRWYASVGEGEMYFFDLVALAPAQLRQAEIMEKLGRPGEAALHYARFVELWQHADPELQDLVSSARRRLQVLGGRGQTGQVGGLVSK